MRLHLNISFRLAAERSCGGLNCGGEWILGYIGKVPNRTVRSDSHLLITGTPMQNTLGGLSALMDFLMPGVIRIEENMDLSSKEVSAKISEMTAAIQPFMLRRTKNKVENDIPQKTEKIIRVELSDVHLDYHKNILTRNYTALNEGAKGQKQSLLNII